MTTVRQEQNAENGNTERTGCKKMKKLMESGKEKDRTEVAAGRRKTRQKQENRENHVHKNML